MKKLFVLILCCTAFFAFADSKPPVRILGVYFTARMPGNVPVDDNGNVMRPVRDTSFVMYVESGKEQIKWGKVWRNNRVYTVIATKISKLPHHPGKAKETGKRTSVTPAKGNVLWHLELVPFVKPAVIPNTIKNDSFLLQVNYGKRSFRISTDKITELIATPSV
jgi:hypothetical protein